MGLTDKYSFQGDLLQEIPNSFSSAIGVQTLNLKLTNSEKSHLWHNCHQKTLSRHASNKLSENSADLLRTQVASNRKMSIYLPEYFRPVVNIKSGKQKETEFDKITSIYFPLPHKQLNFGSVIGKGKYGVVVRAYKHPSESVKNHIPVSQIYAIKCMTDLNSFSIELTAYKHMLRNMNIPLEVDASLVRAQHFNFGCQEIHPLINTLLATTSRKGNQLFEAEEKENTDYSVNYMSNNFKHCKTYYFQLYKLASGGDLAAVALNCVNRAFTPEEAIFYVAEISEALVWLHSIGIVHQDLKLENVLVRSDGHILISDFGLANTLKAKPGSSFPGNVRCTSNHMPPEIAQYRVGTYNVWHAVDWYSLGVLFYRLLENGKYPPVPRVYDMDKYNNWYPRIERIEENCQSLLTGLLCPSPRHRIGGDKTLGGIELFVHPGFIGALLNCPSPMDNDCSEKLERSQTLGSCGRCLSRSLKLAMLQSLLETNATNDSRNADIPQWVIELRGAITNRLLVPPFKPEYWKT